MPFRAAFDCLWCGTAWRATGESDLTGWASLCPDCLERAQDNTFLRYRLRSALRERSGGVATATPPAPPPGPVPVGPPPAADPTDADDWYLRRGRYARGQARDLAWHMELDSATAWLDAQPFEGSIVELAARTGWWSPLLAGKGELSLYDAADEPLERARERLVAHRLRAHIHVRDAWQEPDRQVDGVFCARWLGELSDERLTDFLALAGRWLRPGGRFAFIDALPDPESGPVDASPPGRARTVAELMAALARAGLVDAEVTTTPRFFVMGSALKPD